MSGQWEVVGKKKDKNGKNSKQAVVKEQQQQKLITGVKVEDVLSASQLRNMYESKYNKENRKCTPEKPTKKEVNSKEKQSQKQQPSKKQPQDNKVKLFKSIDNAFNSIKADELSAVYDKAKVVYPTLPLVWLRELAQFLNTQIVVDTPDVTFASKPDYYPLCIMPPALRLVLEKGLKQTGSDICALFYDICLTSMAIDMNKNLPAIGHKVFMQLLSQQYPKLAIGNVNKYITLRNSYLNRPNIGMSILWALGQGGLKDLTVGIKVFQDIMYPLLHLKNYTRDILKYLISLLKKHSSVSSSALTIDQYMYVTDVVYENKKNMTSELTKELSGVMPLCNQLVLAGSEPSNDCIEPLLRKLGQTANKTCKNHLSFVLAKCMQKDSKNLNVWEDNYAKNLTASASLLIHIEQNWRSISSQVDVKPFNDLLKRLTSINEDLDKTRKGDIDGLVECVNGVRRLNNKMAGNKKKGSSSYRCLYVVILLVGTFVFIDVKQNGGWDNSCTSKALNQTGVYDYTNKVYDCASECTHWMHNHIEQTFPGITETTIKHTSPYIDLGRDLGIISINIVNNAKEAVVSRIPIVVDTVESYAPGFIGKAQDTANSAWTLSVTYFETGKEYLMTEVFVGKLAPGEIQKTISTLIEIGTEKAQEYYSWLYNKIMTTIK